jgi:hemerythrin-like domain-containing protein
VTLCPQLRRLSAEHSRWLTELERGTREDPADRAARLLALWDAEILPHCRIEEEVLLPELARRLSGTDATVVFTLADHLALRHLARELRTAEGPERAIALDALERKVAEHAAFEDRTLLPALQETLGRDRLAALATELASSRTQREHRPAERPQARHATPNARKGRKS